MPIEPSSETLQAVLRDGSRQRLAPVLRELGCRNAEKSAANLLAVTARLGTTLAPVVMVAARAAPDPDLALNGLERLSEAAAPKPLHDIVAGPRAAELLTVLGTSPFLTSILVTQMHLLSELFDSDRLEAARSEPDMLRELERRIPPGADLPLLQKELRLFKKQEVLRIGARDLNGKAPLPILTAEIAALAGACLQMAWKGCDILLRRQYGAPREEGGEGGEAQFTILGMGKLGGRELNFSSDIDLMFFYSSAQGATTGVPDPSGKNQGAIPLPVYFVKLANLIVKALSQPTADGFVFRVDLDLRPEGKSGDTAQSLSYAETYYESWGQSWERSALIKARPVAGSLPLGEKLLKDLQPFIFRRYLDFGMIEDLKVMKQKIDGGLERRREGDGNIKLGRGGIREIEFFVQALQLIHAGKHPFLRVANTLEALDRLAGGGFIPAPDHAAMKEAYLFLRTVENHIQIFQERQTHSLPSQPESFLTLARSCGFPDGESFRARLEQHRGHVEAIYHSLFFGGREEAAPNLNDDCLLLLDRNTGQREAETILSRRGFPTPAAALKRLLVLRDGPPHVWLTPKARRLLTRIAPLFVQDILDAPDPETALRNSEEFFAALRSQTSVFALLAENPRLIHLLVSLFSTSALLSRFFIEDPGALDALAASAFASFWKKRETLALELVGVIGNCASYEEKLDALRRFRHEEFLRIALNDIQGQAPQEQVASQLSDLADACLEQAVVIARQELMGRYGLPGARSPDGESFREASLAVVALGKLGGRELSYHSELDLFFLFDEEGETAPSPEHGAGKFRLLNNREYFSRLAQRVISILTLRTAVGQVFQVDSGIRPSGRQGPLVSSLASFAGYHREGTRTWERRALAKARVVSAPPALKAAIEAEIGRIVYEAPLPPDFPGELRALRERTESEQTTGPKNGFDLRSGPGGLLDVEFLVQYLQIRHGRRRFALRGTNTLELLTALHSEGILNAEDHQRLAAGCRFLLRLENRLRLLQDRATDALCRDPEYLCRLALRLGYPPSPQAPGAALLSDYRQTAETIREIYGRLLDDRVPERA
ncbi:MAG: bifunctional [glutamate--ammonia ligase]-adenylyl-L-tyrosine phosphorylase/[glutamate--ammonia-ligase] adenylyltransferase [Deltaproteobacteria bacterium]|nr:bifunctional [glutamate--ammonia ligase]-adenylyl-L-tyrosine phosphorylase/[glutamate--ammonia-ligase] adenylyltransferase [Deltaproteobacteria bacterium]